MITQKQIEELSQKYQIDSFTIFREYLQLIFLNFLFQNKKSTKIYFKGGTAIHLLLNSPRFSEYLDFSTFYDEKEIEKITKDIEKEIQKEIKGIKILFLYKGKKTVRFRLKYQSPDFKYPFVIKIDFNKTKNLDKIQTSSLITSFPIMFFPIVLHLSEKEILAEKIRALLTRGKGRDVFDLWFLLKRGIKIDQKLIIKKFKEIEEEFEQKKLIKKIKDFSQKSLEFDLNKFLPRSQKKIIKILKRELEILLRKDVASLHDHNAKDIK